MPIIQDPSENALNKPDVTPCLSDSRFICMHNHSPPVGVTCLVLINMGHQELTINRHIVQVMKPTDASVLSKMEIKKIKPYTAGNKKKPWHSTARCAGGPFTALGVLLRSVHGECVRDAWQRLGLCLYPFIQLTLLHLVFWRWFVYGCKYLFKKRTCFVREIPVAACVNKDPVPEDCSNMQDTNPCGMSSLYIGLCVSFGDACFSAQ